MRFANIPTYTLTLPSTGETIKYRPYVVKEEKILIMAMQDGNEEHMRQAMADIVHACTFGAVDIAVNPMFDIQYVFLKLRCRSVGEIAEVELQCGECKATRPASINLDDISVAEADPEAKMLTIGEYVLSMRYPTVDTLLTIKSGKDDAVFRAVASCIASITTPEEVVDNNTETAQDFIDFVENMTSVQYETLIQFFATMPSLTHQINFTCECGRENIVVFDGLYNFFQ